MAARRFLIVNADDFGYCNKRNKGIVEGFCSGVISSVSLLVNASFSVEAIQMAREHHIPLGLHLNLTEGHPVSEHLHTLTGKSGLFRGKMGFRDALREGIIDEDEIQTEINAQLNWFKQNVGSLPTHVDGHQHIHVLPIVCGILSNIMQDNQVTKTRNPIECCLKDCSWIELPRMEFYESVVRDARSACETFTNAGICFPSHFVGLGTMGKDMTLERLQQALVKSFMSVQECQKQPKILSKYRVITTSSSWSNTCELMVHPGHIGIPGHGGCGEGPDEFSLSQDREHELRILTSEGLKDFLKTENFVLTSFSDL